MKTLNIDLDHHNYPIHIGAGLLYQKELITPHIHGKQVFIISNEIVAPLYLDTLISTLGKAYEISTYILPDGEQTKNLTQLEAVFTVMLELPCDRSVTIIALGGGVVGDLAGFCAASYLRGVNFIQVPTTLLSQVDSSVGGKTGVNHALGKNMIGAFHQPQVVIIDSDTLSTLDQRQFAAGMAEVIKYALLGDLDFLAWLEQNIKAIMQRDEALISHIIEISCKAKANIVAQDEKEQGIRALLNLGHTFGHAIENAKGYGQWLHGEAIALGMLMAADLSHRMGMLDYAAIERITNILKAADLPIDGVSGVSAKQLRQLMSVDKKVLSGKLRLVLYQSLGDAQIIDNAPETLIMESIAQYIK
jgi:3-dehydroquinate synthase